MTIGKRIKKLRIDKGMSQQDLATKIGLTKENLSRWENDRSKPRVFYIPLLAEALGCTYDYILYGEQLSLQDVVRDNVIDKIIVAPHGDAYYLQFTFKDGSQLRVTDNIVFRKHKSLNFKEVLI